jgi:hypothetical protein
MKLSEVDELGGFELMLSDVGRLLRRWNCKRRPWEGNNKRKIL